MIKCENCIMPKLLKSTIIGMHDKLGDAFIECGNLKADIDIMREDLKEAYLYILAVKEYNQNDYGRGDLITKARQYLHLEV